MNFRAIRGQTVTIAKSGVCMEFLFVIGSAPIIVTQVVA